MTDRELTAAIRSRIASTHLAPRAFKVTQLRCGHVAVSARPHIVESVHSFHLEMAIAIKDLCPDATFSLVVLP